MKIHFSGIGGIGISALAQLCLERGDKIQGSDLSKSEIWPILESKNIQLFLTQTSENITEDIDLLVYSEAVPETNPERKRARELKIPEKSYFEYLGEVSQDFFTIAVAGTHGKTTTTALISAGMVEADFGANMIVGTTLKEFGGSNFHSGSEKILLVEACEYRENFRFLSPDVLVLTNIEWDHIDAFPTEKSYFKAFENLLRRSKTVLHHEDDSNAQKILEKFSGKKVSVSNDIVLDLQVMGEFNQRNARLAKAVAKELNISHEKFAKGLQKFSGAGRRQEFLGKKEGILVYDDYAHHPSELQALLQGLRKKFPGKKIGIIFEPHQFSRTKQFFPEFIEALKQFDTAAFYPIYAARDTEEDKKFDLPKEIQKYSDIEFVDSPEKIPGIFGDLSDGDILLFAGAGNISAFAREWMKNS